VTLYVGGGFNVHSSSPANDNSRRWLDDVEDESAGRRRRHTKAVIYLSSTAGRARNFPYNFLAALSVGH